MDQQAFRQLLATPRNESASSSSASSISAAQKHFGKTIQRKGLQSSPGSSSLLPRKFERSVKSDGAVAEKVKEPLVNSVTGEEYVDRAAARRLAGENEDETGERMRRLEKRLEETFDEEEREKIKRQIRSLDEDARVKKGLDLDLLAMQKARLKGGGKADGSVDDDDLELAYGAGSATEKEAREENRGRVAAPSKFKPIGSTSKDAKGVEEEKPEYIWRDGKRLRKKKKKEAANGHSSSFQDISTRAHPAAEVPIQAGETRSTSQKEPIQATIPPNKGKEEVQAPEHPIVPDPPPSVEQERIPGSGTKDSPNISDDDGGDIFADAGRWQGLHDSDAEDDDPRKAIDREKMDRAVKIAVKPSGKKDWFATGTKDILQDDEMQAHLPNDLGNIVKGAEKAKEDHGRLKVFPESTHQSETDEGTESSPPKIERLEGFSDSILGREGVRYMLEKKDDDGPDRKRRRKRSKKGKGGYGSD